jgi:hypothetical protein
LAPARSNRAFSTVARGNIVIEVDQMAERLRAEFNPVVHATSCSGDRSAGREWWQRLAPREWRDLVSIAWYRRRR